MNYIKWCFARSRLACVFLSPSQPTGLYCSFGAAVMMQYKTFSSVASASGCIFSRENPTETTNRRRRVEKRAGQLMLQLYNIYIYSYNVKSVCATKLICRFLGSFPPCSIWNYTVARRRRWRSARAIYIKLNNINIQLLIFFFLFLYSPYLIPPLQSIVVAAKTFYFSLFIQFCETDVSLKYLHE